VSNARLLATVAILILLGWVIYLLGPVLTPFMVAALLAYIGNPAVSALEKRRVPRVLSVAVVFALFTLTFVGLMFFLLPLLRDQITAFAARVPTYYDWGVTQWPRLERWLGVSLNFDITAVRESLTEHWREAGQWATAALGFAALSGLTVIRWFVNLVLIPVVTFYLLLDWNHIVAQIDALLLPAYRSRARLLARETDQVLSSFFRGQLMVMLALATVYSGGLLAAGLDLALPIGITAGVLSFVPYLGFIVGLLSAGIAAYLQYQEAAVLIWVAAVFGVGQALEGMFLTPRLVGSRIGLHPVAVIFAVMAGGQLFGFIGVLVALPVAAAMKVWLRHAHDAWVHPVTARARRR
jgi:predicted PurR-regulated permease PerM